MQYLKNMESSLTEEQKDMLKRIYAPTVVAVPLSNARKNVCILPDGEIRSYGMLYRSSIWSKDGQSAYLSSKDCGLSWSLHYAYGKMNSCTYLEKGGIYMSACSRCDDDSGMGIDCGLAILRSKIGPDDPNPEVVPVGNEEYGCCYLPQQSQYTNRIWFTAQTRNYENLPASLAISGRPVFFYSDDMGTTWTKREIPDPNCFEVEFPHKGKRWCVGSGTEPVVTEMDKNHLLMILRTPMDCFYKSESFDGGDTWSIPEPTDFYGTDTTAYLLKLSDGRVIHFWNNAKPLSQPNHEKMAQSDWLIHGYTDWVCTNRDVAHAAISEDNGKSFIGYREILLNEIRNHGDFRYVGGGKDCMDKSIHQFQAFELPFNKVLVSLGQNAVARRILIFDVNWLYETARKEDFMDGLVNVTTHTYLKSVSGDHFAEVGNGHCSWNRTYSAYPVPNPEGGFAEVLSVAKHHDDRLFNDIGGVGWNFPLAKQGKVTVEIKIAEKQARFILADRWYNVCDPYVTRFAPFWFELDTLDVGDGYAKVVIEYDTEKGMATVSVNDAFLCKVRMTGACNVGISYLIMQCACDGDSKGFYIKSMEKE